VFIRDPFCRSVDLAVPFADEFLPPPVQFLHRCEGIALYELLLDVIEWSFDFLYEYSYKKSYTKDFFIRIFLKRALKYSILS
jgi:hypothetical protein